MLNICLKFYHDILNVFCFFYKVQRGITKIHNQELCFCTLHVVVRSLIFVWSFMKMEGFKVIEPTWFCVKRWYLQNSKRHNSKTHPRVTVLDIIQHWLIFYEFTNGFKVVEQTRFCHRNCYLQSSSVHNSKIYIKESWFLCSARRLMLVNISMKLHEYILKGFKVKERTRFCKIKKKKKKKPTKKLLLAKIKWA